MENNLQTSTTWQNDGIAKATETVALPFGNIRSTAKTVETVPGLRNTLTSGHTTFQKSTTLFSSVNMLMTYL